MFELGCLRFEHGCCGNLAEENSDPSPGGQPIKKREDVYGSSSGAYGLSMDAVGTRDNL